MRFADHWTAPRCQPWPPTHVPRPTLAASSVQSTAISSTSSSFRSPRMLDPFRPSVGPRWVPQTAERSSSPRSSPRPPVEPPGPAHCRAVRFRSSCRISIEWVAVVAHRRREVRPQVRGPRRAPCGRRRRCSPRSTCPAARLAARPSARRTQGSAMSARFATAWRMDCGSRPGSAAASSSARRAAWAARPSARRCGAHLRLLRRGEGDLRTVDVRHAADSDAADLDAAVHDGRVAVGGESCGRPTRSALPHRAASTRRIVVLHGFHGRWPPSISTVTGCSSAAGDARRDDADGDGPPTRSSAFNWSDFP